MRTESGGSMRMILDGHTCMFTPEYDPTRLTSSVAGKFARQLVTEGSHVNAGDAYVEIEVMKMYMPLKAPEAGIISFQMSEGAVLTPGDLLAIVTLDEPDKVIKSELYTGFLTVPFTTRTVGFSDEFDTKSDLSKDDVTSIPAHVNMRNTLKEIEKVLDGYLLTEDEIHIAVEKYLNGFHDRLVPVLEIDEALSVLRGRIDNNLFNDINDINTNYRLLIETMQTSMTTTNSTKNTTSNNNNNNNNNNNSATNTPNKNTNNSSLNNTIWPDFPANILLTRIHEFALTFPSDKRHIFMNQIAPLWLIIEQYLYSAEIRKLIALQKLMEKYLIVEKLFDNMSFTDVVSELRKFHTNNLTTVLGLCRSHINLKAKNILIIRLMEEMRVLPIALVANTPESVIVPLRGDMNTRGVKIVLRDLSKLRQAAYIHVSFTANLILINQNNLRPEVRRQRLHETVTTALTTGEPVGKGDRHNILKKFVDSNVVIRDLLLESMRHDKDYRIAVMEVYLLKIYQATHQLTSMSSGHSLGSMNTTENVSWIKFDFHTNYVSAVSQNMTGTSGRSTPRVKDSTTPTSFPAVSPAMTAVAEDPPLPPSDLTPKRTAIRPSFHSLTEQSHLDNNLVHPVVLGQRQGIMACINSTTDLTSIFPLIIQKITNINTQSKDKVNVIHIILLKALLPNGTECSDEEMSECLCNYLSTQMELLSHHGIRRISFLMAHHYTVSTSDNTNDFVKRNTTTSTTKDTTTQFEQTKLSRGISFRSVVSSAHYGGFISIFTFRFRQQFQEDFLCRHIEAPHASHLDLPRLSNFKITLENIPSSSGNVFLYRAIPIINNIPNGPVRFFARLVSFSNELSTNDSESLFVEALDILGIAMSREEATASLTGKSGKTSTANHIFLNILAPSTVLQLDYHYIEVKRICSKYWEKMARLAITCVEVKLNGRLSADSKPLTFRLVASNPTGFVLTVDKYFEEAVEDQIIGGVPGSPQSIKKEEGLNKSVRSYGKTVFRTLNSSVDSITHLGPLDGIDTQTPHEISQKFEKQRADAMAASETLYVYDWPVLFQSSVEKLWSDHEIKNKIIDLRRSNYRKPSFISGHVVSETNNIPKDYFSCRELVLCCPKTRKPLPKGWMAKYVQEGAIMLPVVREPGLNDAGMVSII